MADVTVAQFAEVLKVPVDRLLTQLAEAGIKATSASDVISDDSKMTLLTHLRKSHGHAEGASNAPRKITLKRKTTSTLRTAGSQGRTHTVNVEVRKKRTYVNRDVLEEQARSEQEELDKVQREYYLRQQLRAIQKELGEDDYTEEEIRLMRIKFISEVGN